MRGTDRNSVKKVRWKSQKGERRITDRTEKEKKLIPFGRKGGFGHSLAGQWYMELNSRGYRARRPDRRVGLAPVRFHSLGLH